MSLLSTMVIKSYPGAKQCLEGLYPSQCYIITRSTEHRHIKLPQLRQRPEMLSNIGFLQQFCIIEVCSQYTTMYIKSFGCRGDINRICAMLHGFIRYVSTYNSNKQNFAKFIMLDCTHINTSDVFLKSFDLLD